MTLAVCRRERSYGLREGSAAVRVRHPISTACDRGAATGGTWLRMTAARRAHTPPFLLTAYPESLCYGKVEIGHPDRHSLERHDTKGWHFTDDGAPR